jgi:Ca2+-binding RTX toxin-like protein
MAKIKLDDPTVGQLNDDIRSIGVTGLNGPLQDGADFNANFHWENSPGLNTHIVDLIGTDVRGNPVLPQGDNVPGTVRWQLDAGVSIDVSDGIITYGFLNTNHAVGINNNPHQGEGKGYSPFTPAQMAAARIAIQNWDDLIAPDFQEVAQGPGAKSWAQNTSDILLANTTTGPAQAWAYYPGSGHQYTRLSSDVWIADPRVNASNGQFLPGQYGLQTLNHELGHTLGLSHPGAYNFGDDNDGDGLPDPITYEGDAFYFQDSNQFTIMSYFDSYETGAQNVDWNLMRFIYPSTPMVDDVFVIQQKYGAETTTRTGDTTYGFNSTADVTNEAMKFHAGEMFTIFTIWDAGGKDTIDLSGYNTPSVIDLREGAYSSAGGAGAYDASQLARELTLEEINANNVAAGFGPRTAALHDIYYVGVAGTNEGVSWKDITGTSDQYLMEQNIGIAYGAIVENAIGGAGNDRINGNAANNEFTGNGGADTFIIADYSGTVPDPANLAGRTVVDTSIDTIMDFQTGQDKIDLTSFGPLTAADVSYTSGDLHFSANGHDYAVHLLGVAVDLNNDILFG